MINFAPLIMGHIFYRKVGLCDFSLMTVIFAGILFVSSCVGGKDCKADADAVLEICHERLKHGKTYVFETGFDEAIDCYETRGDTVALIQMCRLAAGRMCWKNEPDSAVLYIEKALCYATDLTSPDVSDLNMELSYIYCDPLLPKDS